jgi:FkbM family methyltransferase
MYSQNHEQAYITEYFNGRKGKVLDVGAFHPYKFSNSRRLIELGWEAILIEPAPSLFTAFEELYKDNPKIQLLNIAIGDTTDHVKFYESEGDAVSTTDEAHKLKWEKAGVPFKEITVPMMETTWFFNQYCKGVDFISIDTESTNFQIFSRIPDWVWQEISCLCIEHDQRFYEIKGKLVDYGFKELHRNAENLILGK